MLFVESFIGEKSSPRIAAGRHDSGRGVERLDRELMGCLAVVFVWVATGANAAIANYGPVIDTAYRLRVWLFAIAILVLIGTNYKTLGELPYVNTLPQLPAAAVQPTQVVVEQWAWTITPDTFKVGQTAEFHVTSKDLSVAASQPPP